MRMSESSALVRPSPTSCVEGSHVNRTVRRGKDSQRKTTEICGLNAYASLASSDRVGACLRMCLESELQSLTGLLLTFKDKGTPSGLSWWVLDMSVPRTEEIESSSSRDWMTPKAGMSPGGFNRGTTGREFEKTTDLVSQVGIWENVHQKRCDGPRRQAHINTSGKDFGALRLNPAWVLQLMGFPEDWLDV